MTSNRLEGKVALITGAARGIGRATAERMAREGALVVLADLDADAGTAAANSIGERARFVRADVSDRAQAQAMVDAAVEAFGRLDILVNNAGITRDASFRKMSEDQFDAVISVNLKGVYNAAQAAIEPLKASSAGRILNAASVVAHNGNFGQTNYVAAKAGVIGMTKTWARELGRYGITSNAVAPGFVQTEMIETVPEHVIGALTDRTPVGRLGSADDIAAAYAFLASDDAAFITGAVLNVDGGLTL
jgi:3-oxoacyl-[acyl-carrier protein] reductase